METGDLSILDIKVPYYDMGSGTILEHMETSIDFTMNHLGQHNIPLMLGSDWNDCLNTICKKGKGESVMVCEQLILACKQMREIYSLINKDPSKISHFIEKEEKVLNNTFFDKDHFARATTDSGLIVGRSSDPYGRIWLNSNSWAVYAEVSDIKRLNLAMDSVMNNLDSDIGLVKLYPALVPNYPSKEEEISWATPGIGENGGVFCHANTWAIIALCKLNRGNEAFKIYDELMPNHVASKVGVERYLCEPYIYSSNIRALYTERGGEAGVSWVTGTSTWMYHAATQYILGIRPKFNGLEIKPCLPKNMDDLTVTRVFRNCKYTINIHRDSNKQNGLYINDEFIQGNIIASKQNEVFVECIVD